MVPVNFWTPGAKKPTHLAFLGTLEKTGPVVGVLETMTRAAPRGAVQKAALELIALERAAEMFANPHKWTLTHRGVPAPELGWVDRKVWKDAFGRTLEVTRHFGSDAYRGALLSPSGGLLILREGKDPARLSAQLKREARKLAPGEKGESLLERDGQLWLSRPGDAHKRDLTEFDLAEIEQYEVMSLHEKGGLGLRLNNRLVLAMIREIRRHREKAVRAARKKAS